MHYAANDGAHHTLRTDSSPARGSEKQRGEFWGTDEWRDKETVLGSLCKGSPETIPGLSKWPCQFSCKLEVQARNQTSFFSSSSYPLYPSLSDIRKGFQVAAASRTRPHEKVPACLSCFAGSWYFSIPPFSCKARRRRIVLREIRGWHAGVQNRRRHGSPQLVPGCRHQLGQVSLCLLLPTAGGQARQGKTFPGRRAQEILRGYLHGVNLLQLLTLGTFFFVNFQKNYRHHLSHTYSTSTGPYTAKLLHVRCMILLKLQNDVCCKKKKNGEWW